MSTTTNTRPGSLTAWFRQMEDDVSDVKCSMNWTVKDVGFGQFYFYYDDQGKLHISSETMGPNFVKKVLGTMVDSAIFDDFRDGTLTGKEITPEVWANRHEPTPD